MQTRDELYETLNYKKYEEKIDRILEEKKELE
jgi:dihydroneopterin aldolase